MSADAAKLIATLEGGGVAIFPTDVGYAIVGNRESAIERIFAAKARSFDKPCGMFSSRTMFRELAIADARDRRFVAAVIDEAGLPLSVVVRHRADHPFFTGLTPLIRERSSRGGTIDMLLNAGALHEAVAQLSWTRRVPVLGSSANRSLTGSKYRLEDVEPEVRDAADLVLDGGATRYDHPDGMGSTIIELGSLRPLRRGILFDRICDICAAVTGIDPRRAVEGEANAAV